MPDPEACTKFLGKEFRFLVPVALSLSDVDGGNEEAAPIFPSPSGGAVSTSELLVEAFDGRLLQMPSPHWKFSGGSGKAGLRRVEVLGS